MNQLPPLSSHERERLRASIEQDGVRYPVLLDQHGAIIDGFHRQEIADELGVECPTQTLDVDDETADRLRLTLNWARRQMTKLEEYEVLAAMADKHWPEASQQAKQRQRCGQGGVLLRDTLSLSKTSDVVAVRINAELEEMGETKRVSGKMIERSRMTARLPTETKQRVRDGEISMTAALRPTLRAPKPDRAQKQERRVPEKLPERPRLDDETSRLRAIQAATDYEAMRNAPADTLNIPLIRRVERIVEVIGDLVALEPEVAVTQLPAERYHQFAFMHFAEWLLKFTHLCEEKRRELTPDLEPRIYRTPRDNPVILQREVAAVNDERLLGTAEQVTLHWLRKQSEPTTMKGIAAGLRISESAVQQRLRRLLLSGYVIEAGLVRGKTRSAMTYQAPSGEEP